MDLISPMRQHAWVAAGVVGGSVVGSVVNLFRSGWLGKNMMDCNAPFNGFAPFVAINDFREFNRVGLGVPKVMAFNPLVPCIYALPMLACAVWNSVQEAKTLQQATLKDRAKIAWRHISSEVLYPTAAGAATVVGAGFLAKKVLPELLPEGIDPSGHVAFSLTLAIHAAQYFKGIEKTGTTNQKRLFTALASLIAVTDLVWCYNTAASCHSVADIVFGALSTAVPLLALDRSLLLYSRCCQRWAPVNGPAKLPSASCVGKQSPPSGEEKQQVQVPPVIPTESETPLPPNPPADLQPHQRSSTPLNLWLTGGAFFGLGMGMISRMLRGDSETQVNLSHCLAFGNLPLVGQVNNARQIMFPLVPALFLLSSTGISIWNAVRARKAEDTARQVARVAGKEMMETIAKPWLHTLAAGAVGTALLGRPQQPLFQILLALHTARVVQGINKVGTPSQRKVFEKIAIALAATDLIWCYNTAANCAGLSFVSSSSFVAGLSFMAIEFAKRAYDRKPLWSIAKLRRRRSLPKYKTTDITAAVGIATERHKRGRLEHLDLAVSRQLLGGT